jgi:cytidylate kinase
LYSAVGNKALSYRVTSYYPEVAVQHAKSLVPADLEDDDLRTARVAQAASKIAAIPAVRAVLLDFQRDFASRGGGAVLVGRDIGTVICPNAEIKLFVTASAEVRANRRFLELTAKGEVTDFETVLADVVARDERDANRDAAPMIAAKDAIVIDTSDMSIAEAVAMAITAIKEKTP